MIGACVMAIVGYQRVSSIDQNLERQLINQKCDKVFSDKYTGKTVDRPGLKMMLEYVREGDTLIVQSLDRLSRSLSDAYNLITGLIEKGVKVKIIEERFEFGGGTHLDPTSELQLNVIGSVVQFQLKMMKRSQQAGIDRQKELDQKRPFVDRKYKGRKRKLDNEQMKYLNDEYKRGVSMRSLMRQFNISKMTVYRYLERYEELLNGSNPSLDYYQYKLPI